MEKLVATEVLIEKLINKEASVESVLSVMDTLELKAFFEATIPREFLINLVNLYARQEYADLLEPIIAYVGGFQFDPRHYDIVTLSNSAKSGVSRFTEDTSKTQYRDITESGMVDPKVNTFHAPLPCKENEIFDILQDFIAEPVVTKIKLTLSVLRSTPFPLSSATIPMIQKLFGDGPEAALLPPHMLCAKCLVGLNEHFRGVFAQDPLFKEMCKEFNTKDETILVEHMLISVLNYGVFRDPGIRFPARYINVILNCDSMNRSATFSCLKYIGDPVIVAAFMTEQYLTFLHKYTTEDSPVITLEGCVLRADEDLPKDDTPEWTALMIAYHDAHALADACGEGTKIVKGFYPQCETIESYICDMRRMITKLNWYCKNKLASCPQRILEACEDKVCEIMAAYGKLNLFAEVSKALFDRLGVVYGTIFTQQRFRWK